MTARGAPWQYALFVVLAWIFIAFHEMAHGVACKKFGGSVSEMGLLWRYLAIFPYCKIEDVQLFHNRWHRVYTSFAGIFVNFLSLLPFGTLWVITPAYSLLHTISALMLLSCDFSTLANAIPFIELDGYFMLNHALNMVDLRREAHLFWKRLLLKKLLKRGKGNSGLSPRETLIYLVYGSLSLLFTAAFLICMLFYWFRIASFLLHVIVPGILWTMPWP